MISPFVIPHINLALFKLRIYHVQSSHSSEMWAIRVSVEPAETRWNFPTRPLSIMCRRLNMTARNKSSGVQPGIEQLSTGTAVPRLIFSNEFVSWNVCLSNEYHSTPSSSGGCLQLQMRMELWVMSQTFTDRTGRTCLYAVYTVATHMCSFFVFSLCCVQKHLICL